MRCLLLSGEMNGRVLEVHHSPLQPAYSSYGGIPSWLGTTVLAGRHPPEWSAYPRSSLLSKLLGLFSAAILVLVARLSFATLLATWEILDSSVLLRILVILHSLVLFQFL